MKDRRNYVYIGPDMVVSTFEMNICCILFFVSLGPGPRWAGGGGYDSDGKAGPGHTCSSSPPTPNSCWILNPQAA